jgi:hypothetical protein
MELSEIIISAVITIFSIGLLSVAVASYRKYTQMKLLVIAMVFFVFLLKGVLLTGQLFFKDLTVFVNQPYASVFDLIILLLLFIATLKR